MCGRYTETASLQALRGRFGFRTELAELKPRYNLAPSQDAPVVVNEDGRRLRLMRWGLIPSWAKEPAIGRKMINAKAETLAEKPSFRGPLRRSRCLVIADGFYEWRKVPGGKIPLRIALESGEPFAMAGLWDLWRDPAGAEVRSFAVVTTAANRTLSEIHDRMPAILSREAEDLWLDPASDLGALAAALRPCPDDALTFAEASRRVSSPAHDDPGCLAPGA